LPPNENYKKTLCWTQQGITQSEIARRLEITPISVRRYIIWLQNEGYLEKKTDVKLSKREQDVFELKEKGFGLRKIASELKCSEQNVRYFLKSALSKGYEPKNNKEDDI
jgi:DNA-binding NarL/FixJ family response regulator